MYTDAAAIVFRTAGLMTTSGTPSCFKPINIPETANCEITNPTSTQNGRVAILLHLYMRFGAMATVALSGLSEEFCNISNRYSYYK